MIAARQIFLGRGCGKSLPYDAEVEYLESTGTQYINTGVVATNSHGFSIDIATAQKEGATNTRIFGAHEGNTRCGFALYGLAESQDFFFGWNEATGYTANLPQRFVVSLNYKNDRSAIFNGTTYLSQLGTLGNMTQPIYLLNADYNNAPFSGQFTIGRLYGAKITIGSDVAHEYIPVRFTNELGQSEGAMYDRVSGQLFRNQGTGAFVVGPDKTAWVNPYVTDGLVAMWDGEWNVKGGVHDSTTTIWKDLAGNYDLDVDLTQAEWSDDFLKVTGTTCTRDTEVDNVLTAEVVYRDAYGSGYPNNEGSYFTFGHARGPCSFWYGHVISGGANIGDGVTVPSNGFSTNDISPQRTVRHSFSFIYKIGDVAWYRDASSYALYYPPNKSIQSGVRAYCASPSEGIELTCVRLYSRALTADEIAANYAIDKQRFNLP